MPEKAYKKGVQNKERVIVESESKVRLKKPFIEKLKHWLYVLLIAGIVIFVSSILGIFVFIKEGRILGDYIENHFDARYSHIIDKWGKAASSLFGKNYKELDVDKNVSVKSNGTNNLGKNTTSAYDPSKELTVQVVRRVLPGVVSIALDQTNLAYGAVFVNEQAKIGSGFVIDAKNGIIVTNRHVVDAVKTNNYKVILQNGKALNIIKILEDPVNDIAFVFVNPHNIKLTALPLGDSDSLVLGEQVIAIGTPYGEFPSTVTSGIISGLHRKVTAPADWGQKIYFNVIQTDAPINPGNSGGPLINLAGEVVGINFAKINGADNISFALPINLVKTRLMQYREYGRFRQAFLGVSVRELDLVSANYYGVPAGALVLQIVPNSPAYKAGIKVKDIIVAVDNQPVFKVGLVNILNQYKVGDNLKLHIKRPILNKDGYGYKFKDINVVVKLADRYKFVNDMK